MSNTTEDEFIRSTRGFVYVDENRNLFIRFHVCIENEILIRWFIFNLRNRELFMRIILCGIYLWFYSRKFKD